MTRPPEDSSAEPDRPNEPFGQPPPPPQPAYPPQLSPEMSRGYLPYNNYPAGMTPVPPPPGTAYAHWGFRVAATLVDGVLGSLVYYPLLLILALVGGVPMSTETAAGVPIRALDGSALFFGWGIYPDWFQVGSLVAYLIGVGFVLWNTVWRQGRTGSSIGKSMVRIQVVGEGTGAPIGPGMTFVRALCHLLDALPCYLGYLWPLWDQKRQTFADKIMHTVVVPLPPAAPKL